MTRAYLILFALIMGLCLGIFTQDSFPSMLKSADIIGTAWLNALRMTVVPLIISLLITGVLQAANMARAGSMTLKTIIIMVVILWCSSIMAAIVTPSLLTLFPLGDASILAMQAALGDAEPIGEVPPFSAFLQALIPTNVISSASNDEILPLIIFTLLFAFAVSRLEKKQRNTIADFFAALSEAMLIMINWVLNIAPIGVFALAMTVGAKAGAAAFAALIHYVLIVTAVGAIIWIAAFFLVVFGARKNPIIFFKAAIPSQVLAISTQSSLACLPAMVKGSHKFGVGSRSTDVVLPIAVALFRSTGPCMNLAVVIYIAYLLGIDLSITALAIGVAVAATTTLGAVSLPGSVSFIASIAPICIAMGVPIEPLVILVAIEAFPDLMRTIGNVTMNMSVTATIARSENDLSKTHYLS